MKKNSCRLCGSKNLFEFLDLGFSPISDQIVTKEQLDEQEEELLKNNMKFNIVFTMGGERGIFEQPEYYEDEMDTDDFDNTHTFRLSTG